jgi:hypothetical protein
MEDFYQNNIILRTLHYDMYKMIFFMIKNIGYFFINIYIFFQNKSMTKCFSVFR